MSYRTSPSSRRATRDPSHAGVQPVGRTPQNTFIYVYQDVWEVLRGKTALSVYMALKAHINDDGSAWFIKRKDLAAEAGVGETAFDNGIKVLESYGLVEVVHRYVPADWDRRDEGEISFVRTERHKVQIANLYRLHFNLPHPSRKTGDPSPVKRETPSRESGYGVISPELKPREIKHSPPTPPEGVGSNEEPGPWENFELPIEGPVEAPVEDSPPKDPAPPSPPVPGKGPVPEAYTPEFEDWWSRYPKRAGKRDAFKAWWKVVRTLSPTELNAHTDRYAAWVAAGGVSEVKYVPAGSKWLNGERWLDELEAPAGGKPTRPRTEYDDLLDNVWGEDSRPREESEANPFHNDGWDPGLVIDHDTPEETA